MKKIRKVLLWSLLPLALAAGCGYALLSSVPVNLARTPPPENRADIIARLRVPDDVAVNLFSAAVPNARQLAVGPDGWIFVGTRADSVYALRDSNNDGQAEVVRKLADGLKSPHGVAYADGKLYVGEIPRVLVSEDINEALAENRPPRFVPYVSGLPTSGHHGMRHLIMSPSGNLHIALGAPCNVCETTANTGVIRRYDSDGKNSELIADGVRNAVGMDFHPDTGELWFTDNGRDWMGDELPGDELNRVQELGQHFGFPYCHQGDLLDPEFGGERSCDEFAAPVLLTGPHVANLGMVFTPGHSALPGRFDGGVFIALHGSWNRSVKIGYEVSFADIREGARAENYRVFASGWLSDDKESVWGRPVDVVFAADGALLVSDDYAGAVWRFVGTGEKTALMNSTESIGLAESMELRESIDSTGAIESWE